VLNAANLDQLREGKFDVVLLGDIFEHMPDPAAFLSKVRLCLHPNGVVIVTTPNALHYLNAISVFWGRSITRRQHTAWFCSVTLRNMFRFAGYAQEKILFLNYWDDLLRPGRRNLPRLLRFIIERVLLSMRPELSPCLMGIYRVDEEFNASFVERVYRERWHP
jgi:SAM-dependent methyltransferase